MKLPNRDKSYIPPSKLHRYLLSLSHATGHSKALFFRRFGFNEHNATLLEDGLLAIAQTVDVSHEIITTFGVKYVIDGSLQTPRNSIITVRTVWIVEQGEYRPRFVTAYPKDKKREQ